MRLFGVVLNKSELNYLRQWTFKAISRMNNGGLIMLEEMKKALSYPYDTKFIMAKTKKIKKCLLESGHNFIDKRIAILGGSTTNAIKLVLEVFLLNYDIRPDFYESEYNGYYTEGAFENENLKKFNPDIIYIYTTNRNISKYPSLDMKTEEVDNLLADELTKFKRLWEFIAGNYHCPIIQNNFEMPDFRLMGNMDGTDIHGTVNFINRLNTAIVSYAQTHNNFYVLDINYISADYGLSKWHDSTYWYMYKYALSMDAIPYLSSNVANIVKSLYGKNKKGLVLDLDNTLWGGVIGDEGVDGILLGPEDAEGEAYWEFQKYIKAHAPLGIFLNIDSKNEVKNAIAGLKHPCAILKEEDFAVIKANWKPKSENFIEIAKNLNVLPESLVFVDDNPAERAIIEQQIGTVSLPILDAVQNYIRVIDRNGYFETTSVSYDDRKRNQMYKENVERNKAETSFTSYDQYLQYLQMKAEVGKFIPVYLERITQLINKTNQFNLTTKRYSSNEIEYAANNNANITLYGKLSDRFGDNGLISAMIGRIEGDRGHIDLWIMSCRVFKRTMEYAMMDKFVQECKEREIRTIYGYYYPTAKNAMVSDLYRKLGFQKLSEDDTRSVWVLETENYQWKNRYIEVSACR